MYEETQKHWKETDSSSLHSICGLQSNFDSGLSFSLEYDLIRSRYQKSLDELNVAKIHVQIAFFTLSELRWRVTLDLRLAENYGLCTQYVCTYLRGSFVYFIWNYWVCHFLTGSFIASSPFLLFIFNLVRRYDVSLCNGKSKNSIEDWLNLTCMFLYFRYFHYASQEKRR